MTISRQQALAVLAIALALSGCGGGGGDDGGGSAANGGGASGGTVTADQVATSGDFISLVMRLVTSGDDGSEPLTLPTAAGPGNDTAEPASTTGS